MPGDVLLLCVLAILLTSVPEVSSSWVDVETGPSTIHVVRGQTVTLPCTYTMSHPSGDLTITWWREPTVSSDTRQIVHEARRPGDPVGRGYNQWEGRTSLAGQASLRMETVGTEDAGTYECEIRNFQHGAGRDYVTLNVIGGHPAPGITWTNAGHILEQTPVSTTDSQVSSTLNLLLSKEDNRAQVTCSATQDGTPPLTDSVLLNVTFLYWERDKVYWVSDPPEGTITITPGWITVGQAVYLHCQVDSNPPLRGGVRWGRVGRPLPADGVVGSHDKPIVADRDPGASLTPLKIATITLASVGGIALCLALIVRLRDTCRRKAPTPVPRDKEARRVNHVNLQLTPDHAAQDQPNEERQILRSDSGVYEQDQDPVPLGFTLSSRTCPWLTEDHPLVQQLHDVLIDPDRVELGPILDEATSHVRAPEVSCFLQEGITMKGLDHKNVLGLLGVCVPQDGYPMVVLPFMQHGSLLSYLRNDQNVRD
uniref:Ig-like domain-containing protein n=1 Tax=Branchiostoma floridae TaxID=7739 RepID=C3XRK3_BRAFL|eukprot:XP_002613312.1 hypothetical protein BRAFLDRAFT_68278 [Branchiostoma floridae]